MERRSWPWKKKYFEKSGTEKVSAALEPSVGVALSNSSDQDYKKPKADYVKIPVDVYSHLAGLEDRVKEYGDEVKTLEDDIKHLDQKLSESRLEVITKDGLVKQHAKVAEEAVSGWEKAEAEALALKNSLDAVTLSKIAAEDRTSHLDGALKECMRQIRSLKEEHEHRLHEAVLSANRQWEKLKLKLDSRIDEAEQQLLRSVAENSALSRSLQERSAASARASEERSRAEAAAELLKAGLLSSEKEVESLRFELHLSSKELEIRNEEKNMSLRSAEAASRQHLDAVRKAARLEAECHRLRGLVRKKLPGPAAIAQMKIEVESLGRGGDPEPGARRARPRPRGGPPLLPGRPVGGDEEAEALRVELQASRDLCSKLSKRIHDLETRVEMVRPTSDDGPAPKSGDSDSLIDRMGLMDDFLEMERLACMSEPGRTEEAGPLEELRSKILAVFEYGNCEFEKVVHDIESFVREARGKPVESCVFKEIHCPDPEGYPGPEVHCPDEMDPAVEEEAAVVSRVLDSVLVLARGRSELRDKGRDGELGREIELVRERAGRVLCGKAGLGDLVGPLSVILSVVGGGWSAGSSVRSERGGDSDCVDKAALHEGGEAEEGGGAPGGDDDVGDDTGGVPRGEFERVVEDLARAEARLEEAERQLAESRTALEAARNSNVLAETQLRCMAESYRSLEVRAEEMRAEVDRLETRAGGLEEELLEGRRGREEALCRCRDLEDELKRTRSVNSSTMDPGLKLKQEEELEAAAEKLAECQESIFLLRRQLKPARLQKPAGGRWDDLEPTDRYGPAESDPEFLSRSPTRPRVTNQGSSRSGSSSSSTSTPEKHTRGFTRFFSSKGMNGY